MTETLARKSVEETHCKLCHRRRSLQVAIGPHSLEREKFRGDRHLQWPLLSSGLFSFSFSSLRNFSRLRYKLTHLFNISLYFDHPLSPAFHLLSSRYGAIHPAILRTHTLLVCIPADFLVTPRSLLQTLAMQFRRNLVL